MNCSQPSSVRKQLPVFTRFTKKDLNLVLCTYPDRVRSTCFFFHYLRFIFYMNEICMMPIRIFYCISLCKIPGFVVRSYPSLVSSIRSKDTIQIPNQNQNENMKKFSSATFSQQISNKNIHTYIHNWSLQPISQDYWPCLIFIHKWQDLQFKVDSEWQVFLRNYSWQF